MRKSILSIVLCALLSISLNAQTYYRMWRGSGEAGFPEWIANLSLNYNTTGIQFSTANRLAGYVNNNGRWFFNDPNESVLSINYINGINTRLNQMGHVAVGTQGYIASTRMIITDLTLTSNIDSFWGYGRNMEITLSNQISSPFRINSYGGVSIWGNGLAMENDLPQFEVKGTEVNSFVTMNLKDSNRATKASLLLGRNNDVTFTSAPNKMFRVAIPGGSLGLWLNASVFEDDNPIAVFNQDNFSVNLPVIVRGDMTYTKNNVSFAVKNNSSNDAAWIGTTSNHGLAIGINGVTAAYFDSEKKNLYVGFDKSTSSQIRSDLKEKFGLFVRKGILSSDYNIAPVDSWSDFVFEPDYSLMSLEELEAFIVRQRHLPNVPSQSEVSEQGYSQHEVNKALLQKIEELTLYIIQQQKEIEDLKSRIQ